ncbi:hypothetical protein D8L93_03505 [Sodalis-like symbiont of Bactericera trigonica]|nr:hypothetical protein D8L93_03505 [Sodalis-like symbiont of Bactericera trigonica]
MLPRPFAGSLPSQAKGHLGRPRGYLKTQQTHGEDKLGVDAMRSIRFNAPRCPDSSVGRAGD